MFCDFTLNTEPKTLSKVSLLLSENDLTPLRQYPSSGSDDRQRFSPTAGLSLDDYEARQEVLPSYFITGFLY